MLGLGGGREVIGLQVAPAGTEDPEEKSEVCHLTGGGPFIPPFLLYGVVDVAFSLTASF